MKKDGVEKYDQIPESEYLKVELYDIKYYYYYFFFNIFNSQYFLTHI